MPDNTGQEIELGTTVRAVENATRGGDLSIPPCEGALAQRGRSGSIYGLNGKEFSEEEKTFSIGRKAFQFLDLDKSGTLSREEFVDALCCAGKAHALATFDINQLANDDKHDGMSKIKRSSSIDSLLGCSFCSQGAPELYTTRESVENAEEGALGAGDQCLFGEFPQLDSENHSDRLTKEAQVMCNDIFGAAAAAADKEEGLELPDFLDKLRPKHKRIMSALVKMSQSKGEFESDQSIIHGPLRFVTRTGIILTASWTARPTFSLRYLPAWISVCVACLHLFSVLRTLLPKNDRFFARLGLKTAGRRMLVSSNIFCVAGYLLTAFENDAYYVSPNTQTSLAVPVKGGPYSFGGGVKKGDLCSTAMFANMISYLWQGQICGVMGMVCVFQLILVKAASWDLSPYGKASQVFHDLKLQCVTINSVNAHKQPARLTNMHLVYDAFQTYSDLKMKRPMSIDLSGMLSSIKTTALSIASSFVNAQELTPPVDNVDDVISTLIANRVRSEEGRGSSSHPRDQQGWAVVFFVAIFLGTMPGLNSNKIVQPCGETFGEYTNKVTLVIFSITQSLAGFAGLYVFVKTGQKIATSFTEPSTLLSCLKATITPTASATMDIPCLLLSTPGNIQGWRQAHGLAEDNATTRFIQLEPVIVIMFCADLFCTTMLFVSVLIMEQPYYDNIPSFTFVFVMIFTTPSFACLFKCAAINDQLRNLHVALREDALSASIQAGLQESVTNAQSEEFNKHDTLIRIADQIQTHKKNLTILGFEVTMTSILLFRSYLFAALSTVLFTVVRGGTGVSEL